MTCGRGRARVLCAVTMKVRDVVNPRKPSKVAAVIPASATEGCCNSSSQVMDSVKERPPEWRTTTPLAGRCHRPDCTIQRTWRAWTVETAPWSALWTVFCVAIGAANYGVWVLQVSLQRHFVNPNR